MEYDVNDFIGVFDGVFEKEYCDDLINLLEERKQMTDRQLAHERSVFLIVAESQSFRSLIKPVSDDFIQNLSDTATKLLSLIKEGSLYGIFVVISSASLQNWKSIFELSTIEYFKHRCLLPMNQASSYEFISSNDAYELNNSDYPNPAILYQSSTGSITKFKPYIYTTESYDDEQNFINNLIK